MPKTRLQIRNSVRHKLGAWPEVYTTLNGAVSSTTTTSIIVTDSTGIAPRMLIEVDSETMFVKSISVNTLTVYRGFHGTTAATHTDTADVNAYQPFGWTNTQINLGIDSATTYLSSDPFPLWNMKFYTGTWPANTYEVDLSNSIIDSPQAVGMVLKVEFYDDSTPTKKVPITNYEQNKSILRVAALFSEARTFRVKLANFQGRLANDSSQLDANDYEDVVVLFTSYWMLKDLQGSRVKYIEYSASLNERASTADELLRTSFDFKNQADLMKRAYHQPIPKELRRWFGGRLI